MSGAQRFEDLIVWQIAVELREVLYQLTESARVQRDQEFVRQIRSSACSIPRNISEGFAKYDPPEFARYMNIAKGSIAETQNHLRHGRAQKYFTEEDYTKAWRLACRTLRAASRLHAYLRTCGKHHKPGQSRTPQNPEPEEPRGTPQNPAEPEPRRTW